MLRMACLDVSLCTLHVGHGMPRIAKCTLQVAHCKLRIACDMMHVAAIAALRARRFRRPPSGCAAAVVLVRALCVLCVAYCMLRGGWCDAGFSRGVLRVAPVP
jgi:hypothetical protein